MHDRALMVMLAGWTVTACKDATAPTRSFAALSLGTYNTCALTAEGAPYCWGNNSTGQIGNGDTTFVTIPWRVSGSGQSFTFAQIHAGSFFACALTYSGAAYCWGLNAYDELGVGTDPGPECSPGFSCRMTPLAVVGGLTFTSIASMGPSCGVTPDNLVYCWGLNNSGQLGTGVTRGVNSPVPVLVPGGPSFIAVTVGGAHVCGLSVAHAVYCWGQNAGSGQLGDSTFTNNSTPVRLAGGFTFDKVVAGMNHTCGLTSTGTAYCWGGNGRGEIGDGTTIDRGAPVAVIGGQTFVAISGGWEHTCALTSGGAAYCWGMNADGQLGDGSTLDRYAPHPVTTTLSFTAIGAGKAHSCGLTAEGVIYCWGDNTFGELGNGTTISSKAPVRVAQ